MSTPDPDREASAVDELLDRLADGDPLHVRARNEIQRLQGMLRGQERSIKGLVESARSKK